MADVDPVQVAADVVAKELECDVIFYSGDVTQADWVKFSKLCHERNRNKNVVLVLITPGGDPDAAYKIGRALQTTYTSVYTYVPGWCKSAGTLIAIASCTLFIGDMGELGPLDIQIAKQDELDEMASGLLLDATLRTLESTASRMFISFLKTVRKETGISTRTASDLSAKVISGLLGPVFAQIEPMKIGETARAVNITKAYAQRLNNISKSVSSNILLEFLLNAYPDHGFVIDRAEAKIIFRDVREPTASLLGLCGTLGDRSLYPRPGASGGADIRFLSTELPMVRSSSKGEVSDGHAKQEGKGGRGRAGVRPVRPSRTRTPRAPHRPNGSEAPANADRQE